MMMNKQKTFTAAGIALSFIIAIGGWGLTSMMIDRKSEALLSVTGITYVDVPPQPTSINHDTENSTLQERQTLTDEDIYNVLLNWEASGNERAHEPTDTQLSMEQAIEAAKSGLEYFGEQGVIPIKIFEQEFEKINAYLCQNQTVGQASEFLDPIYSYWTVVLTGESTHATLVLNAVTGQIWSADIVISSPDAFFEHEDTRKVLNTFVSYLGMNSDDDNTSVGIYRNDSVAYTNIADSMIQASVNIQTGRTDNASIITEINMYLSALNH